MGFLRRVFGLRYRRVTSLQELGSGRVEVDGLVEGISAVPHPATGDDVVAVAYQAWPPSTTVGVDGAGADASRGFKVAARQATDFILVLGGARVRVRVPGGEDVAALHADLVDRYGVGLRAEIDVIQAGDRVRVLGQATQASDGGSPHRRDPDAGIIEAERFWTLPA